MGKISDLTKYRIANVFGQTYFWGGIFLLYAQDKGISAAQIISLIGIMSLVVVISEYPTGVIGDRFSHKTSVIVGNLIAGAALLGMFLAPTPLLFSVAIVSSGVGFAFKSGSDEALLNSLSKDLSKDLGKIRGEGLLSALITTTLGSLLVSIHLYLPLFMSVFSYLLAALALSSIKVDQVRSSKGDIFKTAKEGFTYALKTPTILYSILLSIPFAIMIKNQKWFSNPLFEELEISALHWGWLIAVMILVRVVANRLSGKLNNSILLYALFLLSTLAFGFSQLGVIVLLPLILTAPLGEVINNKIDSKLTKLIPDGIKASVLSLKALTHRLAIALFMLLASGVMEAYSLAYLSIFAFILFTLIALLTYRKSILTNE